MRFLLSLPVLFIVAVCTAQNVPAVTTLNPAESRQFDFWVGNWNATYGDTGHASNHVTIELDSSVIHEHFSDPANKYTGESWSVYNKNYKLWQQTWVDNQGGYIALSGQFSDGKMVLYTQPFTMRDSIERQNRMVYYNITPQSFDWSWEQTTDKGNTWKVNWAIHYKRKE